MRLNRATLIALATVAISSTAFAQAVQEAATNYEVPSYDTMTLDVHGGDLLTYSKDNSGFWSADLLADWLADWLALKCIYSKLKCHFRMA